MRQTKSNKTTEKALIIGGFLYKVVITRKKLKEIEKLSKSGDFEEYINELLKIQMNNKSVLEVDAIFIY